jgi:hypothetical protein
MQNIIHYLKDGAGNQARAVLAALQYRIGDGLEASYDKEHHRYLAQINVSRWENCREQGYVCMLRTPTYSNQLNIAWFEHRNSDDICAVMWEQVSMNSPTIDTAQFGNLYKSSHDVSMTVGCSKYQEMADWIFGQLRDYWVANYKEKEI